MLQLFLGDFFAGSLVAGLQFGQRRTNCLTLIITALFVNCDEARKAQTAGHGLGLSIARIIAVAHEGKINVRSKVGVGTTFSVAVAVPRACAAVSVTSSPACRV